jgi:hypothetical protein
MRLRRLNVHGSISSVNDGSLHFFATKCQANVLRGECIRLLTVDQEEAAFPPVK